MMLRRFPLQFLWAAATAAVVQGADSVTVCSAGECITGQSNITRLGAVLSSSSASYVLLPGQYTSSVQPATLEQALASATSTITFTTGFSNTTTPSTPSLPLTIALQPGLLNYPNEPYTGDPTFLKLPQGVNSTFTATSINRGSIILSANTVAAIEADNNGAKSRVVIWDTVPYISQLPYNMAGNLQVLSIQSSSCSPACASSAVCSTAGTCVCPPNFTGDSCESCAAGHFGPSCKACPSGCSSCDDGITGTGTCRTPSLPANAPANCNCANGVCGTGGTCTCSTGWTTSTTTGNSTQCNTCADGFFKDSSGNCESCGARCSRCADTTGTCTQCNTGLTVNSFQNQLCGIAQQCADGQFASGTTCAVCNTACSTCSGPAATDCIKCASGTFLLNGQCVGISTVPASGVCTGSSLVANPLKGVCDTCPLGCATCSYSVFGASSQYSDVKCTKCSPGKFLSGGSCIDTCPDGTFAASDGTCTACASSCGTCINSADYCVSCKNNQFASLGACVSSCPTNMFSNSGTCTQCHPDCASCSGPGFNQCLSCPSSSPILTSSKRCVPTCAKTEYFDSSSSTCKTCDSSCGSCSAGGSSSCLSCSANTQVLRGGVCKTVASTNGETTTSGLGVFLAELVIAPNAPPADIPPIDPNASQPTSHGHGLKWWQILLIVLGILLLLAIILLLWRRRQRKKRAQQTEQFKQNMKQKGLWSRLWRNPFAGWWARRRSAMINRRSDVERMSDAKDWRTTTHSGTDALSPTYGSDRRTAVGVPKSIGRGSWVTTGVPASVDGRTYAERSNGNGLRAIRESREWENDRYTERSYRSGSRRYDEPRRGESQFYAQEIDQDDGRSERTRSERTYDQYQYPRPSSRNSDDRTDLVSIIRSEVPESERRYQYDDRESRRQYSERSRSNYGRSERSYRDRSYREERSIRQDYPASVSTESQSRSYDRRPYPSSSSHSHGPDTPSMYSQPTLHHIRLPPPAANPFDMEPPRDAVLSSRFSMSTAAASTHPPTKIKRKEVPEPMPPLEAPRQLTDAEMYKMSKLFPDLLGLMSPKKNANALTGDRPEAVGSKSPSRNPFRI